MMRAGRKAQVASGMTWFVAFLVIFFIMMVFLMFCASLVSKNKVEVATSQVSSEEIPSFGRESVILEKNQEKLTLTKNFLAILKTPIGEVSNSNYPPVAESFEKSLKDGRFKEITFISLLSLVIKTEGKPREYGYNEWYKIVFRDNLQKLALDLGTLPFRLRLERYDFIFLSSRTNYIRGKEGIVFPVYASDKFTNLFFEYDDTEIANNFFKFRYIKIKNGN